MYSSPCQSSVGSTYHAMALDSSVLSQSDTNGSYRCEFIILMVGDSVYFGDQIWIPRV